MSERQKKGDGPAFSFEISGTKYEFTPNNSHLYLYSETPEMDHFRLRGAGSIFRPQLNNFDSMAFFAEKNGFPIFPNTYPDDEVFRVYTERFGPPPLPEFDEITRRNERKIQFGIYLMDHMETVEDVL